VTRRLGSSQCMLRQKESASGVRSADCLPMGRVALDTRLQATYVSRMTKPRRSTRVVAPWLIVAGGLLMASLWLVYTGVHGPTSYQEDHLVLGQGPHLWGMLLGVVPNSLIAGGLIALRGVLTPNNLAAIGHSLTCGALLVPAVLDLAVQAINAPFFLPVQAVGVVMLAAGLGRVP
jgi:hypothetical protein